MTSNTHIALLRGVNVGGRHKLPMKALVALFEDAGCKDVKTYIQSGNVVYSASGKTASAVPSVIPKAIAKVFSLQVPVITRTAEELAQVAIVNPFLKNGVDPKALHVGFLADTPKSENVAALDFERSLPDVFRVIGRHLYLFCPNGLARTKLTNDYFDNTLATTTTIRNWNTVQRLLAMANT